MMAGMSAKKHTAGSPGSAADLAVAVVVSRYHADVTDRLLKGAKQAWGEAGGSPEDLAVFHSPGAFELPILTMHAATSQAFDAVVALGCILKGETQHDRVLAEAVAQGLVQSSLLSGVPITLGVLTVDTHEQALARAGGPEGNKGAEAMLAAIACASTVRAMGEIAEEMAPLEMDGLFESEAERAEVERLIDKIRTRINAGAATPRGPRR